MGRKWPESFACEGFVCFPLRQIYLGLRWFSVCLQKSTAARGPYTFIDVPLTVLTNVVENPAVIEMQPPSSCLLHLCVAC